MTDVRFCKVQFEKPPLALGRVDNSWVNLRRLGNQLGGILEPFVLVIILS
jgi:hypothetical protein